MTITLSTPLPEAATRPILSRGRTRRSISQAQACVGAISNTRPGNYPAGNHSARVFRDLASAFQRDAAAERIDVLAAELASCVADAPGSLCLGLVHKETVPKLYGLVFLLDGYGLVLRQRYREQGDGVFVFLDRKGDAVSEFVGSVVVERIVERVVERFADVALPRAA